MENAKKKKLSQAMAFIVMLGIVSMFSDMTHEAASSIRGAYLALLGASAATIGFVSGLGELVGYSLRFLFGLFTDKTKKYWTMTILGYAIDVLSVPALALVSEDGWIFACALLILERTGKAIKKPAKNTILSFAAAQEGAGKSFAIQEALDQIGAFLGPMLLYVVMLFKSGSTYSVYRLCFAILIIPALITLLILALAKKQFPHPENFEPEPKELVPFRVRPSFVIYLAAIGLFAFGFIDFSLITMHVSRSGLLSAAQLPLLYAAAMLVDAVSALFFGWLFDKYGFKSLIFSTLISAFFAPLVFGFNTLSAIMCGVALWGLGMGAQESVLKAAVSAMIPKRSRAAGYGVFELSFGLFWFLGSWLLGALYDLSMPALIAVSVGAQLLSVPLFWLSAVRKRSEDSSQ